MNRNEIYIRKLELSDCSSLLDLRLRNRDFLQPFEPLHQEAFYTLSGQSGILEKLTQSWGQGTGYGFGIFLRNSEKLIGRVSLSNVVRGAWESCTIGYFLDQRYNGHGIMTRAVRLAVGFAFEQAFLHRVQGAVMPRNTASIRVLEKVGFVYEGLAKYYLKINGHWENHHIYSITREQWNS